MIAVGASALVPSTPLSALRQVEVGYISAISSPSAPDYANLRSDAAGQDAFATVAVEKLPVCVQVT